jgi:hypothetical protein
MAPVKFILTVVSLAILHASFDALPVNALTVERSHAGRDFSHVHAEIAKKRGDSSKKCRPRSTSASQSSAPTANSNYAPSSNPSEPAHTTSSSQSATASSSQSAATNAPASSINSKVMYGWSNNEQPSIPNFVTGSTRLCVHSLIVSGFSPLTPSAQSLQLEIAKIFGY